MEGTVEKAAARRIVDLTNTVRRAHSLAQLSVNPHLTLDAEAYAGVLAQRDWFDHVGPDGSSVDGRAEAAGYLGWTYLAENLAKGGSIDAADILNGWMKSTGHRENILSPRLQEIGVGCYVRVKPDRRFWCVQDFGTTGR